MDRFGQQNFRQVGTYLKFVDNYNLMWRQTGELVWKHHYKNVFTTLMMPRDIARQVTKLFGNQQWEYLWVSCENRLTWWA